MKFDYYTQMFARAFDFRGKSNLKEYWFVVLYNLIFSLCALLIALPFVIDFQVFYAVSVSVASLYEIVVFVPMLALTVRRLHDANHSALAFLWLLLPFVGEVIFIVYLASPSNSSINFWPFSPQSNKMSESNSNIENNTSDKKFEETTTTLNGENKETSIEHRDEIYEKENSTLQTEASTQPDKTTEIKPKSEPIKIDDSKISISETELSRSERIATLQKMHENGEISDEEYQKQVMEILKN